MYARVIQFTTPVETVDEAVRIMEVHSKPTISSQEGFAGGYWLVDRTTGRGVVINLWATEEALREADAVSARLRQDGIDFGMVMEAVSAYEVVAEASRPA
jgi:hypothetical protein